MLNLTQQGSLQDIINTVSKQWSLTALMPLKESDDRYVAKAMMQGRQPVVLKIHSRKQLFMSEYNTLTHFQGSGSIKLLDSHHECKALLLDQAIPGLSLANSMTLNFKEKLTIYCEVIKSLSVKPLPSLNVIDPVSIWFKIIDDAKHLPHIDRRHYEKACELRDKLSSSQKNQYVCHGDLHFGNIINHQNDWVIIDPVGVVGEMEFEVATCDLLTSRQAYTGPESSQILQIATLLAQTLNLDLDRLLSWCFLRKFCLKAKVK